MQKQPKSGRPDPAFWPKALSRLPRLEFRRVPLLAAACCFAMGELLARRWHPPIMLLVAIVLLTAFILLSLRRSLRMAVVPLAALWITVGIWSAQIQPATSTQSELAGYADGLSRQIHGRVIRVRHLPAQRADPTQDVESSWWPEKEEDEEAAASGLLSIDIAVDSIEQVTPDIAYMVPVQGGVRINVISDAARFSRDGLLDDARAGAMPDVHCGDVIEAHVRLKIPERYNDPGAWQYADYLLAQGIGAHANVRSAKLRDVAEPGNRNWQCRIYAAQSWASGRVDRYVQSSANRGMPRAFRLSPDDGGMLNAMLFGDRAGLNRQQRTGFERTGSFHLFVVSGMHVALVAGLVFWMARRLLLPEWAATISTLTISFGYAVLTGFGAPVQRALFMTAVFLIARLLSRDRNVLNALGAATLGVLVWSPSALFESSFQMTFLAILSIGGIAIPFAERTFLPYARAAEGLGDRWVDTTLPPRVAEFRMMLRMWGELLGGAFGRWVRPLPALAVRGAMFALELALVGAVAEMVMVLPMAVYFHRATVFAIPTNMLSVPLVAVLVPMAVIMFCASLVGPWFAFLPATLTAILLHAVDIMIGRISAVHIADMRVPPPAGWVEVCALAVWFFACWAVRRSRAWAIVGVALLPVIAALVLWPERPLLHAGQLEVTAIDVGQGDSLFIASPEGATMLVDAGGPVGAVTEAASATSHFDVGEEVVSPYLWSRRIRRIDVLVLTHAHSDHMGGMPAIMRNFRPKELWVSIDPNSDAYRKLLAEAAELGVKIRHMYAGDTAGWAGTTIHVLAPENGYLNPGDPKNNDSLVLRMQYGSSSVLLEGDAEAPSEQTMLAQHRLEPVTLLKVGHHGSRTSTTQAFLDAVAPKDAVVSVGRGNTFGHPRGEVIARIAAERTKLYRTDEFGLTTFLLGRDGRIEELTGTSNQ